MLQNNHSVKLIAITQPIDPELDAEKLLAYIARVSNPSNQNNHDTATKLLKYMVKNQHWSPFEMVDLVIEIKCTRTIGRQILRHRSFSFQEFSQRYAKVNEDMFTKVEARLQDAKNRQNSTQSDDKELKEWWEWSQHCHITDAIERYNNALDKGIAKEQARVLLPEGLTMSHMYMKGGLRSWIHYCQLRMGNGTQAEHQAIAKDCWSIICEKFPSLGEIFKENSDA